MALQTEPLTLDHAASIWRWQQSPQIRPWLLDLSPSQASIEDLIERPEDNRHRLALMDAGILVGWLTLGEHSEGSVWWGSFEVAVGPEFQGRGYGRQAVEMVPGCLLAWRDLKIIKIGVFEDNARALSLYSELNYSEVERTWMSTPEGRRRAVLMSNRPEAFRHRKIGFF